MNGTDEPRQDPRRTGHQPPRKRSRRSSKGGGSPDKSATRAKAEKLVKEAGIPHPLAWQVARGEITLNEVLQKMARRDRVDTLMQRHDLPKSLATQVALGQIELDDVLRKRRLADHLDKWAAHSMLHAAQEHGRPVLLGLHGQRTVKGTVVGVEKYEFLFQPLRAEDDAEPDRIHKLQTKFGTEADNEKLLRRGLRKDKKLAGPAEPVEKPQDRYGCSDRRLFGYLDDAVEVQATTLEGDLLKGTVTWMGRWEFGMKLKKGVPVTVWRHALADIREA